MVYDSTDAGWRVLPDQLRDLEGAITTSTSAARGNLGGARPTGPHISCARRSIVATAICLMTATTAACGSSESGPSPTATTQIPLTSSAVDAVSAMITITNYSFANPVAVKPGAEIAVKNQDAVEHTVTSDTGGEFDSEATENGSATFTAPTTPGSYPFHCTYHSSMRGVLVVQ